MIPILKSCFASASATWADKLASTVPKTTSTLVGGSGGRFGLVYSYADFYYHAALMNGFGGQVFDKAGQPVMDNPANVNAMELLVRWIVQPAMNGTPPSIVNAR